MKSSFFIRALVVATALLITPFIQSQNRISAAERNVYADSFVTSAKPASDAIALDARMKALPRISSDQGAPLALVVSVAKKAYVTLLYISSVGDVIVLLPNAETPSNLFEPNKEYTLFGEDAGIRLTVGKKSGRTRIICYVTTKPFEFDLSKLGKEQAFVKISHTSVEDMNKLKEQIQLLSQTQGFNYRVLSVDGARDKGVELKMMGIPKAIQSKKPGSVTGTQGLKEGVEKTDQK